MSRHSTFSSSKIWMLLTVDRKGSGWGAPALKYIKQVKYENMLGRSLNPERDSRQTTWGTFVEQFAFDRLPLHFSLVSNKRIVHPEMNFWSGMADVTSEDSTGDIKCPFSLESFVDQIQACKAGLETYKDEFPEYYWQHISNCVLNGKDYFEPIIYCPYKDDLAAIKNKASLDEHKFHWIGYAEDKELPYLIKGGKFNDLNIFRFAVPESDKELLTTRVKQAGELINK